MNDQFLTCDVCGERLPKAAAPGSGWGLYGLPGDADMIARMEELKALSEDNADPWARLADVQLSMRCNLCIMGSLAASLQLDLSEYPEFAEGVMHYRQALLRKEQGEM